MKISIASCCSVRVAAVGLDSNALVFYSWEFTTAGSDFTEKPKNLSKHAQSCVKSDRQKPRASLRSSGHLWEELLKSSLTYSYSLHTHIAQHHDGWVDLTKSWIKFMLLLRSQSSVHVLMRLKSNEGKQKERLAWLKVEDCDWRSF